MKLKKLCAALSALCMAVISLTVAGCAGVSNAELNKKIEQLQEQVEVLQEKITDLTEQVELSSYKGTFFPLLTAYDNRLLSERQIQNISYYAYGGVYEVAPDEENWRDESTWERVEFTPDKKQDLSDYMERYIKAVYYNNHPEMRNRGYTVDDVVLNCYGVYNGSYYVVKLSERDIVYAAVVVPIRYGNTVMWETGPYFQVFVAG